MAFGNLALFMIGILIIQRRSFSIFDMAYWLVVVALIVVRYVDITRFGGRTASAEPATLGHFQRYALGLVVGAASVWAGVHLLIRLR